MYDTRNLLIIVNLKLKHRYYAALPLIQPNKTPSLFLPGIHQAGLVTLDPQKILLHLRPNHETFKTQD